MFSLINNYQHCLSRDQFDIGCCSFYKAKISLKRDFVPKWVPSRPISYKLQPYMDEEIDKKLKAGHITPCPYSMWNSMVFLTEKRKNATANDISYRFVQDARALNAQCIQDSYHIPNINHILDNMTECQYLSSFDFTSSFTQIPLDKSSQPLTAFSYKNQRYMWTRMIMGHVSSSAEFSRMISQLYSKVPFQNLIFYIDDLLMGSKTVEEHFKRLEFVLERLSWANLKLSPKKTKLFCDEVTFVGYKLSREGLKICEDKIKAIVELKPPDNLRSLQRLLGMVNYNRQFLNNLVILAKPLYALLKKGTPFYWSKECQESFDKIKTALTTSPVLAIPQVHDPLNSYEVTIDASLDGFGATLTQIVSGKRRVIAYFSKAVPIHQKKFGATKLEFLALHHALMHWKIYLQGTRFKVKSDCSALMNLDSIFSKGNSYMQRRLADLAGFNMSIEHISGKSNVVSDFLSRYNYHTDTKNKHTQTDGTPCVEYEDILVVDKINPIVSISQIVILRSNIDVYSRY